MCLFVSLFLFLHFNYTAMSVSHRLWTIDLRRSAKDVAGSIFSTTECMFCYEKASQSCKLTNRVCQCVVKRNGVRDINGPSWTENRELICGAAVCKSCFLEESTAEAEEESDSLFERNCCPFHIG